MSRAYCDQEHPGDDVEADRWCATYHWPALPKPVPETYAFLDDPAEREWLIALDPQDVLANAHRWYEWVAQFGGCLGDSLIRELAFTKAADALGIDYGVLYDAWLTQCRVVTA